MSKNRFCFIAPMFNAGDTVHRMVNSIVAQSYDNWRILLIDDMSSPVHIRKQATFLWSLMHDDRFKGKIDVIWNQKKRWEVENVLLGISKCDDDDIICRIDADDWLVENDALYILNGRYDQFDAIWTAHRWGFSDRNISGPMAVGADVYAHPWVSSHLKTFRKRLINNVPYKNFVNMNGELVRRAGDQCIYLPVLHRASSRTYIPRCMYHYTIDEQGGAVYQTDDARFQKAEADFIRSRGYVTDGQPWEEVLKDA